MDVYALIPVNDEKEDSMQSFLSIASRSTTPVDENTNKK